MGSNRLSDSEGKAVTEADEWTRHNQPMLHEQVLAEFVLTLGDWGKMTAED
jgi:hypothetical protein